MKCLFCKDCSYNEFKEFIYNTDFINMFACNKCNFNVRICDTTNGSKKFTFYIDNKGLNFYIAHFYLLDEKECEFYYNYIYYDTKDQEATCDIKFPTSEEVISYAYKYVSNYLFL